MTALRVLALEHFQVKWTRFTVENAAKTKTRADSTQVKTALVLTAIVLVPSGAHLFELSGKIGLDRDAYFVVQGIYAGWAFFGAPILAAILTNGALFATLRRREPSAARWALASAVLIAVSLALFFTWTFPANQATANWTQKPENWEILRREWEYSHAANAVIVFAAFAATAMAAALRR